jgi:hypothetical protein
MSIEHFRCSTCVWWSHRLPALATADHRLADADHAIGSCHYRPPTMFVVDRAPLSLFPLTHSAQFCSSWETLDDEGGGGGDGDGLPIDNVLPFRDAA